MKNLFQTLGRRIKEERKKRGLTQERLAELTGISNNFISYIESGRKTASLKTIKKIADALEIPLAGLFEGIPLSKKAKIDYATEQILYLIRDKGPSTKRLFLRLCQTLIEEK